MMTSAPFIVYDAHAHAGDAQELALRQQLGLRTLLSCGSRAQAEQGLALAKRHSVLSLTVGVHPWYAAQEALSDLLPMMERAALVGEIGLDSVWCDTPMDAQRRVFSAQLPHVLAASLRAAAALRRQDERLLLQHANGNFCRLLSR